MSVLSSSLWPMEVVAAPALAPDSGLSSPPPACPAAWGWAGGSCCSGREPGASLHCGGRASGKGWGGGGGGNLKVHSLTSNFLMFSGGKGLWEAANDPGSCGSTFLSSLQLKFPAFPYFWPHPSLMQQLDQDQGTSLLRSPPPLLSPGGQWTPL